MDSNCGCSPELADLAVLNIVIPPHYTLQRSIQQALLVGSGSTASGSMDRQSCVYIELECMDTINGI